MDNNTLETCKDLILLAEFYCKEHGGAYNATFRDEVRASVARAIEALTDSQKNTEKLP